MQFELTQALIDEILFFMEDQSGDFVLDTREGAVFNTEFDILDDEDDDGVPDDDRYISLPDWGPSDGFRLMEHFTAGLRNALVREELSAALDRGRGVFRAFKDTLSRYPETEKLWFAWKDREMKREVISWYNSLRETWGLELIGEEPEDIAGLTLEDFRFRDAVAEDAASAEGLHRLCLDELSGGEGELPADGIFSGMGEWVFPGDMGFVVETAGGEFAGYISAARLDVSIAGRMNISEGSPPDNSLRTCAVCAVEVRPEYRGLGLGKTLLARLVEQADKEKIPNVIIDLPAGQEHFSRALVREFFKPCVQRYSRRSSL